MEVLVLDTNFVAVDIVDSFDSLIWADRYSKCGDFEICTGVNLAMLSVLKTDYYLILAESNHVMIVEARGLTTDPEEGNHIVFSGRSLESILYRRIVWDQTILSGNFQDGVEQLLNENAINPTITQRKIPNLRFIVSTDPAITALTISAQFTSENYLYDAIVAMCEALNVGWEITLSNDNWFEFRLYSGVDRSYSQESNPYVIFSPKFDNILNSNYAESKKELKTVSLVAGEGEGSARKTVSVEIDTGGGSGLTRREMYTNATDISSTIDGGTLTEAEYNAQLSQKGKEELAANIEVVSFEGQVDTTVLYKYGEDFSIGDILQIANEYNMETKARVVEFIHSQDLTGSTSYPTFAEV